MYRFIFPFAFGGTLVILDMFLFVTYIYNSISSIHKVATLCVEEYCHTSELFVGVPVKCHGISCLVAGPLGGLVGGCCVPYPDHNFYFEWEHISLFVASFFAGMLCFCLGIYGLFKNDNYGHIKYVEYDSNRGHGMRGSDTHPGIVSNI